MKIPRFFAVLPLILLVFSCSEHTTELIQLDPPAFNPGSGEYYSGQAITITAPEYGAQIYYTADGSEPDQSSELYDSPLIIPDFFPAGADSITLKARAFKEGFDPSETTQADYSVKYFNTVLNPYISPQSGDITTETEIEIFCATLNAEVRYTLDGSEPTQESNLYEESFMISQTGEVTVKARGFRPNWNPSEISSVTYNVTNP